jgi:hypothetical protein
MTSLSELRDVLVGACGWTTYGFIRRGTNASSAALGISLAYDWPMIPHFLAGGPRRAGV